MTPPTQRPPSERAQARGTGPADKPDPPPMQENKPGAGSGTERADTVAAEGTTGGQMASNPAGAAGGAAAGAAAGAVSGIAAGPVGSLAGAVVGGVAGAVMGSGASSKGTPVLPSGAKADGPAPAPSIKPPEERGVAPPDADI